MTAIKLSIPCPYCRGVNTFQTMQGDGRDWNGLGKLKCGYCDSRFEVSLKVNRRGKGKRQKDKDAAIEADRQKRIQEARERNEATLEEWRKLGDCVCVRHLDEHGRRIYQEGRGSDNVPTPIHHSYQCPHGASRGSEASV